MEKLSITEPASASDVVEGMEKLSIAEPAGGNDVGVCGVGSYVLQFGTLPAMSGHSAAKERKRGVWMPKTYATVSEAGAVAVSTEKESEVGDQGRLTRLFHGPMGENFVVDNNTFSWAQIRATFYPKFENKKSDQEIRTRGPE